MAEAPTPPTLPTRSIKPPRVKSGKLSPSGSSHSISPSSAKRTNEYADIVDGLKKIYRTKIRPLEMTYNFEQFHSPYLTDADIEAKPMVLLVGQYSVGKSTFVKHILDREYPGMHIGPEPTTDRFVAVMSGDERIIPGNAAAVTTAMPFTALPRFGSAFLQKFQVSLVPSAVLENVVLIDTPGILSGEKQRIGRSYDFTAVIEWFAGRSDLILLLFDAHKLDISDEFKRVISSLKGNDEKIRVVLNKADMISGQQLMRVYGALMWSLGKVLQTPEVMRVYIGSFWDKPHQHTDCSELLKAEESDLLNDLKQLPRNAVVRKINEIVKRTRQAKVHALIVSHLRKEMPGFFGRDKKQDVLLMNLEAEFFKLQQLHGLTPGDFPDPDRFREKLGMFKIEKFAKLDKKMLAGVDEALGVDFPKLMSHYPTTQPQIPSISQNPFSGDSPSTSSPNPFATPEIWNYSTIDRRPYLEQFRSVAGVDNRASGAAVKPVLEATGLDMTTLAKVWMLADWTKDGYLDSDEFCVAMYLCDVVTRGWGTLPDVLPPSMIPQRRI